MRTTLYILLLVLFSGCGTLAGSQQQVSIVSNPTEAKVLQNDRIVGRTPLTLTVDNDNPSKHTFNVVKEGYTEETVQLRTEVSLVYVVGDLMLGGVPLLIDVATDNLDTFDQRSFSVNLRSTSRVAENSRRNQESSDDESAALSSVFGGNAESEETGSVAQGPGQRDVITVNVDNSEYADYSGILRVIESIPNSEIVDKEYSKRRSTFALKYQGSEDLIEIIRDRFSKNLRVTEASESLITFKILN